MRGGGSPELNKYEKWRAGLDNQREIADLEEDEWSLDSWSSREGHEELFRQQDEKELRIKNLLNEVLGSENEE